MIALIIGVIMYFAIKAGSKSTGQAGGDVSQSSGDTLDSLAGGVGIAETSNNDSLIPSNNNGGGNTPAPVAEFTGGTFSDLSNGFGDLASSDFLGGLTSPNFATPAMAIPASTPAAISNPGALLGTGIAARVSSTPAKSVMDVIAPATNKNLNTLAPAPVKKSDSLTVKQPIIKTDAEKAGLSKYYTGVANGVRYAAGVRIGVVAVTPVKKTAAGMASKAR